MTASEEAAFLARNVLAGDQVRSGDVAPPRSLIRLRSGRTRTRTPPRKAGVEPDGPHVRLGVAWALVTLVALVGGPVWVAVWMAPAAAMAAGSGLRSWQDRPHRPDQALPATAGEAGRAGRPVLVQPRVPLAAGAAGLITLVAAIGPIPTVAVSVLIGVGILAAATFGPRGVPDPARRVLIVLLPAAGASGLVLARAQGMPEGLVLAGMVCVYDSAAYLMGTDAKSRWEGPVAGLASVAALTVLVAAVVAPPFRGSSPWILGGLAAVLVPLGPVVARILVSGPSARVPALRRLDSLLLLGPAWAVAAALLARP